MNDLIFLAPQVPTSLVTGMVPLTWKSTRLKTLQELRLKTVHKPHLLGVTGGSVFNNYLCCVCGWGTVAVLDPLPLPTVALRHPGQHPRPL